MRQQLQPSSFRVSDAKLYIWPEWSASVFRADINHFHQRQVTFNAGNTAAPEKPQSAAPPGEDSISNWFIFRKASLFENVDRFLLN